MVFARAPDILWSLLKLRRHGDRNPCSCRLIFLIVTRKTSKQSYRYMILHAVCLTFHYFMPLQTHVSRNVYMLFDLFPHSSNTRFMILNSAWHISRQQGCLLIWYLKGLYKEVAYDAPFEGIENGVPNNFLAPPHNPRFLHFHWIAQANLWSWQLAESIEQQTRLGFSFHVEKLSRDAEFLSEFIHFRCIFGPKMDGIHFPRTPRFLL